MKKAFTFALLVSLSCVVTGQQSDPLRLVNTIDSSSVNQGRLEIFHDQEWGTVCDDYFGSADAIVACRELGYSTGSVLPYETHAEGVGRVWLDDLSCNGSEAMLSDCGHRGWGSHNCGHHEDVAVLCEHAEDYQLRLVAPTQYYETPQGRLEIYYNSQWGTVCNYNFDHTDATVACRQLSSRYISGYVLPVGSHSAGVGPIWMDQVSCNGNEEKLAHCDHLEWGVHHCNHNEDVAVSCSTEDSMTPESIRETTHAAAVAGPTPAYDSNPREGDPLRLVNTVDSSAVNQGRLEIFHNLEWGTVCDDDFGSADAIVACRQLGYRTGSVLPYATHPQGVGQIWMDDVHCEGSEAMLSDCHQRGWGSHNCGHYEDVAVLCENAEATHLRLVNTIDSSSVNQGRLEIFHDGQWGTVCDDSFASADATVACRELGYSTGSVLPHGTHGEGLDHIWMDEVYCVGYEAKLSDCEHLGWGNHNCWHSEDVSVLCEHAEARDTTNAAGGSGPTSAYPSENYHLKLVNTLNSAANEGRLEIYYDSQWGTVCDDGFDNVDAGVACRQLGYNTGIALYSLHAAGEGPIWLDQVSCSGTESGLSRCSHNGWGTHDCSHHEDVGVICN